MFKEIKETTQVLINKALYDDNFSSNKNISKEINNERTIREIWDTNIHKNSRKRRERKRKKKYLQK